MRHSRGNYTEKHMSRCSRMGGSFGKAVDRLFDSGICNQTDSMYDAHKVESADYKKDVTEFVRTLNDEGLFEYCPPREHVGFPCFTHDTNIREPEKMGVRLSKLSKDKDFWREMSQYARNIDDNNNKYNFRNDASLTWKLYGKTYEPVQ